ncbi:glycosyltransferase [Kyrpidia sp.]|uniref:glycosyltransferase family 2 protein n=1 Tax=Kyrpidia sp. TaxID=2073077 RepID=UPI0025881E3F|nr:glycosyltransferase [Kyrpidia sp.]MCL6575849.1 glycosyltransferase [Kyrpidia sp.]
MDPEVSIILPARNERDHLEQTVRSIWGARSGVTYEMIVVEDGSTDTTPEIADSLAHAALPRELAQRSPEGSKVPVPHAHESPPAAGLNVIHTGGLGAARARNVGAEAARGRILVFCDAHVFVEDGWLDELVQLLRSGDWDAVCPGIAAHDRTDLAGFGQSLSGSGEIRWLPKPEQPQAVPILPGACIAVSSEVFRQVGGFDDGFRTWGFEDIEWSLRMWLMGCRLGTTPNTVVRHVFRKVHPYAVPSYDYYYNLARMALSHFSGPRLARLLRGLSTHPMRFDLLVEVLSHQTLERRQELFNARVHSDEWLVQTFALPLE